MLCRGPALPAQRPARRPVLRRGIVRRIGAGGTPLPLVARAAPCSRHRLSRMNATATTGELRLVSLLPSATEMACALGLADQLLGITHCCGYPPGIRGKPRG